MASPGRPRQVRTFGSNQFTKMIASQVRQMVIKDLMGEFNQTKPNSPAKRRMVEAIKEGMYDRYTPSMYTRRRTNRGLLSKNNIRISYRFPADKADEYLKKRYSFIIYMSNVAKPAPIQSASEWYANAIIGAPIDSFSSEIREKNVKDLLYYWKDQGLVYNLFNDPHFDRWGAPTHFNEILSRKYMKEGRIHKMFGSRLARQLKGLKTKIK